MALRSYDGTKPSIHASAYVDTTAVVIGDVRIEADASVWPNVTLRGDNHPIVIREGANVQDGAVCHEDAVVGPYATVGHCAIVHGATVEARATVGMNAVVLNDAVVGEESIVAAGSVVTEGTEVPPRTLAVGAPAEVRKEITDPYWSDAGERYVEVARRHAETSERLDRSEVEPRREG